MSTISIDLGQVARGINLPANQIESVVRLLDAGNTIPFITRYRKDQTGGLDEEQLREIESRVARLRMLAERKQIILRSIEGQGKLTPELAKQIDQADSIKRLEDLYLPFKPKKQSLATLARERALEPLAAEMLSASPAALDLDQRARDFINPDKQIHTIADALLGVGHIIAEDFSERADLRGRLRKIYKRTGQLVSTKIGKPEKSDRIEPAVAAVSLAASGETVAAAHQHLGMVQTAIDFDAVADGASPASALPVPAPHTAAPAAGHAAPAVELPLAGEENHVPATEQPTVVQPASADVTHVVSPVTQLVDTPHVAQTIVPAHQVEQAASLVVEQAAGEVPVEIAPEHPPTPATAEPAIESQAASIPAAAVAKSVKPGDKKRSKDRDKEKEKEDEGKEFRDYFDYKEQLGRVPPHRVLAINRGEKAKVLRVKIEVDTDEIFAATEEMLVPAGHPHADFLRGCARDALARLVLPSLEREIRRELTENAETHAVDIFARNLRKLLLQAPIRGKRLLAVDPGFKSGCKLAVLDEFGKLLDHGVVHIVGKPERLAAAKAKIVEMVKQHALTAIAIGNGTACRETEEIIAELLASDDLKDTGCAYAIVNEAGASVYSTSPLGREEFPTYDATLRGAISIGRRLQDPLSELVKIDPASIGVGLYQHDVKAKHLRVSLDAVVESCVNYVGVDLNTASPVLLRYVSGLNQLTARRLYDYRIANGPFHNREQLREVPGFGEATFVQAAGFLKITGGDNALDTTWIHPESYDVARRALERLEASVADLNSKESIAALADRVAKLQLEPLAGELQVGTRSLSDIVSQFTRPGRDPREDLPLPMFKKGILKLEDLEPAMELNGCVLNVVDFGAFVDIGLHDSGLVHVSQLANKFVRDPHEVVSVGDVVKVWVLEIDKGRRRVSLTMIPPGTPRPQAPQRRRSPEGQPVEGGAPQGNRPPRPPRPARPRPERPAQPAGQEGAPAGTGKPPFNRPPRGGKPSYGRPQQGGRPQQSQHSAPRPQGPKPKPKPVVPLTDAMKKGAEPLRTFGDLMQFYQQKKSDDPTDQPPGGESKDK